MSNHIKVIDQSYNGPITVRGGYYDGDVFSQDWCNHAGAEMTELQGATTFSPELDGPVEAPSVTRPVCDKCGAQFIDDDEGGEWVE